MWQARRAPTTLAAVDYTTFVQMLRSDRSEAIAALLEQHGDALHDYALTLVGDRLEAVSVLHDAVLVSVVRVDRLRRKAAFVPWLYALVRYEAERRQRRDAVTLLHSGPSHESRWQATSGAAAEFDHRYPGVLDLAVRHGLPAADVGVILGIGAGQARRLVAEAHAVAATVAAGQPAAPLAAMPDAPLAAMPQSLTARVLASATDSDRMAVLAIPIDRLDPDGFPATAPRRAYRRRAVVMAAAALVLLFVTAGVVLSDDAPVRQRAAPPAVPDPGLPSEEASPASPSAVPSSASRTPAAATPTSTHAPSSASPSTSPSAPASTQPDPSPTSSPPAAPVVAIVVSPLLKPCRARWRAKVELTVSGATADTATVTWSWPGEKAQTTNATPDGTGRFTATITGLPRGKPVSFQGAAKFPDGRRGTSGIVVQEAPRCGDD